MKHIEISNFRGIKFFSGNEKDLEFGTHLTVLDGENGFGKTTIFDAIEFCLTGTIKRLKFSKQNKPETILKNNDLKNKESFVKIIFDDGRFLLRKIPADDLGNNIDKIYESIEGNSEILEGVNNDFFEHFFYVPQDNSTELLKESKEGMKVFFHKILNTDEENDFVKNNLDGQNKIIRIIEKRKGRLYAKIMENDKKITENIKKFNEIQEEEIENIAFQENKHLQNFSWYKSKTGKYNKEELDGNKNSFITKWKNLLELHHNQKNLEAYYVNVSILKYKNILVNYKNFLAENYNYYLYFLENNLNNGYLDILDKKYDKWEKFTKNFDLLRTNDEKLSRIQVLFEGLQPGDLYYEEFAEKEKNFQKIQNELKNKNEKEKEYQEIFSNLIDFWENKYCTHKNQNLEINRAKNTIKDDICPLCNNESSKENISQQIYFLKEKLGNISQKGEKIELFSMLFDKDLFEKIHTEFQNIQIQKQRFSEIFQNTGILENFSQLMKKYEGTMHFNVCDAISFDENIGENCKAQNLENINKILLELNRVYRDIENFSDNDFEKYKQMYFDLFLKSYHHKEDILKNISEKEILNNIRFFENEYKKYFNKAKNEISHNIKILEKENEILEIRGDFYQKVLQLLEKYHQNIKENIKIYTAQKISSIGLPLYIFTKKIVKNYNGMGIVLKSDGITMENDKGNPMFSLSSGQAEGLSLALLLANNIKYKSSINTILIDDPIQSLDDLNILSFINLLRYQFPEKQILISTHNDEFSHFIRYKFWRLYGNQSQKGINMKEKFKKDLEITKQ